MTIEELLGYSDEDLGKLATKLGLDLDFESMSKTDAVDEIYAALPDDESEEVMLEIKDTPKKETRTRSKVRAEVAAVDKGPKKYRLIIHNQEGVDNTPFVKVQDGNAGIMYTIPRDVEVVVPEVVISILRDAVTTRYEPSGGTMIERSAPRFPFTVLGTE